MRINLLIYLEMQTLSIRKILILKQYCHTSHTHYQITTMQSASLIIQLFLYGTGHMRGLEHDSQCFTTGEPILSFFTLNLNIASAVAVLSSLLKTPW